jgi:acyl-coenzyme A synthetase/AMP-(fatty) acid ligase
MELKIDYGPFAPPPTHLADRLAYWAAQCPHETAFAFLPDGEADVERITYQELHARAGVIADRLATLNLTGQRALLLYPPGLEFIAALFGCFYAGVVAVPAFPPRRNRNMLRIQAIADDARAAAALTVDDVSRRAGSFFDEAPHLESLDRLAGNGLLVARRKHSRFFAAAASWERLLGCAAIYLGLHGHAQRRDAFAWQLDAQRGAHFARIWVNAAESGCVVAAAVSRYGPDWRHA